MLSLNYRDPRPIYEQVRDSLRQLILSGAIRPGEKLPSVRELASQLAINPNTIQRAYRELEHLGVVDTVPGKGAFAAMDQSGADRRREELRQELQKTLKSMTELGMTGDEVLALTAELLQADERAAGKERQP